MLGLHRHHAPASAEAATETLVPLDAHGEAIYKDMLERHPNLADDLIRRIIRDARLAVVSSYDQASAEAHKPIDPTLLDDRPDNGYPPNFH